MQIVCCCLNYSGVSFANASPALTSKDTMATIQHLEKLRHLQRLFSVEESLEAAVACERLANLCTRTEQVPAAIT